MRRLRMLIPALALALVAGGLTGCHENLTVKQVCDAFREHEQWFVVNYTWAFGVYFCRATTSAGGFDEYCVFPQGEHWFERRECDWDSQMSQAEVEPMIADAEVWANDGRANTLSETHIRVGEAEPDNPLEWVTHFTR